MEKKLANFLQFFQPQGFLYLKKWEFRQQISQNPRDCTLPRHSLPKSLALTLYGAVVKTGCNLSVIFFFVPALADFFFYHTTLSAKFAKSTKIAEKPEV